jgi:hypothetical protein
MARIKVTGYIDTDDLAPDDVDLSHEMGLSDKGYLGQINSLPLDDVEFELEAS